MYGEPYDVPTVEDLVQFCTYLRTEVEGITSDYDIGCVEEDYRRMGGRELYREFLFLEEVSWK